MDIEQLNIEYGITSQLNLIGVSGGFPMILISNSSATALISVYAAQVLSSSLLKNLKFFYFSAQRHITMMAKQSVAAFLYAGPGLARIQKISNGLIMALYGIASGQY